MKDKKVYIASPYTKGDNFENVRKQLDTFNELTSLGYTPFAPLWSCFQHIVYPQSWEAWLTWDLKWLTCCDCVLRLPGESKGADVEVERAKELGIPVYYSISDLVMS